MIICFAIFFWLTFVGLSFPKKINAKPNIKFVKTNNNFSENICRGRFLGLDVTKVERRLKIKMEESFKKLHETSEKYECTFRDASYIVALKKLEDTYQSRGLI